MPVPTLRPYQSDLADLIRAAFQRHRSVLAVAPTGSGKTVLFSYIASRAAARGHRVIIMAHRVELIDQISRSLTDFGTTHGYIAAGYPRAGRLPVQVASVFTLARRLARTPAPTLIIVDEAHHSVRATTWGKVLAAYPDARVLGVTATPIRLSGEGLGECFDDMIVGPTIEELTVSGALVPCKVYAPPLITTDGLHIRGGDFSANELSARADTAKITGDAVDHYRRHAHGRAAIAFCVSIQHAEHVAAQFEAAGYPARSVDGRMDRTLRRDIVAAFTAGHLKVLTSCDLVSEGFDCPRIEVGISLRPTQSFGLWMQQVGRCLRPWPGKSQALIFDHAGNTERHLWTPGMPVEWSLDGGLTRARKSDVEIHVRICPVCFAAVRSGPPLCLECGAQFPVKPRALDEEEGTLVEVDTAAIEAQRVARRLQEKQETYRARDYDSLVTLGRARGYKSPEKWARSIMDWRESKSRERIQAQERSRRTQADLFVLVVHQLADLCLQRNVIAEGQGVDCCRANAPKPARRSSP